MKQNDFLNIAICQLNPCLGDFEFNLNKLFKAVREVHSSSHLIIFPELYLSGYPPEDYLFNRKFLQKNAEYVEKIIKFSSEIDAVLLFGAPYFDGTFLYNSAYIVYKGHLKGIYSKKYLPNYGVFDEKRYFKKLDKPFILEINNAKLGISICEDIWHPDIREKIYLWKGVKILVNLSASPYHRGKFEFKKNFLKARAQDNLCYLVYVNLVGAQDELLFDGRSLVISPEGEILFQGKAFEEEIKVFSIEFKKQEHFTLIDGRLKDEIDLDEGFIEKIKENTLQICLRKEVPFVRENGKFKELQKEEEVYQAIVLGIRDYVKKNGFSKVVLGLSGGIDSSLVCVMACDALGKDRVLPIFMPGPFTSKESREDVYELCQNLKIKFLEIPIDSIFKEFETLLKPFFSSWKFDVADENVQARIRANILFYFSNKEGSLVLSTSNKSEIATGYGTIYGDMAGGFAPLKDVYKTQVYALARYRNSVKKVFPERLFLKTPSAELRANQKDEDTLPPYKILDKILYFYIEKGFTPEEIIKKGFSEETVKKVLFMIKRAEYKRKQAPFGPKVSFRAFGKDWRFPVTCKFKEI